MDSGGFTAHSSAWSKHFPERGNSGSAEGGRVGLSAAENPLELAVSDQVRAMPFLWLNVPDDPGAGSERASIERGSIALLSNHRRAPLDAASKDWLGRWSSREAVRDSHLWNQNYVDEEFDLRFLDILEKRIDTL